MKNRISVWVVIAAVCCVAALRANAQVDIVLRLDASTNEAAQAHLTKWTDSSTNHNDVTLVVAGGDGPAVVMNVLNGKPVVRFSSDAMDSPAITFQTACAVLNFTGGATFSSYEAALGRGFGGTCILQGAGAGSTTLFTSWHVNGSASLTTAFAPLDSYKLLSKTLASPLVMANGIQIGNDRKNALYYWSGDFAEVILYQQALSDNDRKGVEVYLDEKWGLNLGLRTTYGAGTFNADTVYLGLTQAVVSPPGTIITIH